VAILTTADTNFSNTVTALIRKQIDQNLRNAAVYLGALDPVMGTIIKGTNSIRHVAYTDLSVTTNAHTVTPGTAPWLTEGVKPTEEEFAIQYEQYAANQAGRTIQISDVALAESPHMLLSVGAERVSENAAKTVDLWMAEECHAGGTNVLYVGQTSRAVLTAANILTAAYVRRVVALMRAANIPTFAGDEYRAIISPMVAHDLMAETAAGGWLDVARYAAPEAILTGEIGKFAGVRFIQSNVGTLVEVDGGAAAVDAYSTFFFGPQCVAFGDLQSIQAYMVNPGGDHTDPLAQSAVIGWKAMFGTKLLINAASGFRYYRVESASSIGAN
jgi:N4-gp56 family major capsid protein